MTCRNALALLAALRATWLGAGVARAQSLGGTWRAEGHNPDGRAYGGVETGGDAPPRGGAGTQGA
ncbi:MAG: hypothetical protein JXJ18_06710 [Rhodobacteraceae bacterium]|nr:hypothetical protein [Paracoccaceae bacterium]